MTIIVFDYPSDALRAAQELERMNIPHSDISFIGNNREGWYEQSGLRGDKLKHRKKDSDHDGKDDRVEGAQEGAGLGGALGAGAGLLAGLGMLAIPGIGPVVAAGWIASTAAGAAAGAVAGGAVGGGAVGGVLGMLGTAGVPEADAHVYAEGVRRGGSILSVRADDARVREVERVMNQMGGVDAAARGNAYRGSGWSQFDPAGSQDYSEQQIAEERARQLSATKS